MGFEPTTFCMASRRSSQLSYSRTEASLASVDDRGSGVAEVVERQLEPGQRAAGPRVLAAPIVGEAVDQH